MAGRERAPGGPPRIKAVRAHDRASLEARAVLMLDPPYLHVPVVVEPIPGATSAEAEA